MSTTLIDGGPCGPDEAAGQFRNRILTDRAVWWEATGGRQGVRRGFDLTTIPGQMALTAAGGLGFVEERDSNGDPTTDRGYAVWSDGDQVLSFGAASASDRNDAVVLAFVDVSVGVAAVGTETTAAGGQLVVVPGVSGVTTPRTDTQISAAVGSGGWVRLADVLVESTDSEIQAANITLNPAGYAASRHRLALSLSSDQTIPNDTITAITWQTEGYNTGLTWSGDSITIQRDGLYLVSLTTNVVGQESGSYLGVWVEQDGQTVVGQSHRMEPSGFAYKIVNGAAVVEASAGDVLTAYARTTDSNGLSLASGQGGAGATGTRLEVTELPS